MIKKIYKRLHELTCEKCIYYHPENNTCNARKCSGHEPHIGLFDVIDCKPVIDMGNVSDGYHTFNELYDHRAKLFSVICSDHKEKAWKSKFHEDGNMYDGMFIVGIDCDGKMATYHYDIKPYWNMFNVKELEHAPKWDGHTPSEAIERIVNCYGRANND